MRTDKLMVLMTEVAVVELKLRKQLFALYDDHAIVNKQKPA